MPDTNHRYSTLDEWIRSEAIPFSLDAPERFNAAVDKLINQLGDRVALLGFGEPMHGAEEFLQFRNRLFQRLVEAHGFTAIAEESSFPRGRVVNEYVAGRGAASFDDVKDSGFSHGFGKSAGNRELVEWMRAYNADPAHRSKLHFYGFDGPMEMMNTDSPRALLTFALDYLTLVDPERARERRERIEPLLVRDEDWETQEAAMNPSKSLGLTPAAAALRLEAEELVTELRVRRPTFVAATDELRFLEALHYARSAKQLLTYHAAVARDSQDRLADILGRRDLMMADNLAYIVDRERDNGRVLAFAHNSHLKRGNAEWQLGSHHLAWWPAGAQLSEMMGSRYAVIGSGIGASEIQGLAQPEPGSLEAHLIASNGPARFIPTHLGAGLPATEISALAARSGSTKNPTYFAFSPQSVTDFDWLAVLD